MSEKIGAVVLAAGRGSRMHTPVAKQFLELKGRPMITYALAAFQDSPVHEIILVTAAEYLDYCRKEIVEAYGFTKVKAVTEGGRERYHSVYAGLRALEECGGADTVLIHDGARPLVTKEIIRRAIDGAREHQACVIGMPVKDTIKICDDEGFGAGTPERKKLWQIQTPQAFSFSLVLDAYRRILAEPDGQEGITDDAMVVEAMTACRVKLIGGDYRNIKVTTPEDILIAEALLERG